MFHSKGNAFYKSKACLMALAMALAIFAAPRIAAFAAGSGANLTRVQARDTIFAAAGKYRENLKPTDIMSGYSDGSLKEAQAVTRVEALSMISRAFGALPKPGNSWARTATDEKYEGAPAWAEGGLANLYAAGVLAPAADGALSGTITAAELDTLVKRVYALYGTRLEDDFYAAINKEWLDNQEEPGRIGGFGTGRKLIASQIDTILDDTLKGTWEKGTPERKIVDMYNSIVDKAAQAKTGIAPIKTSLDALDAATTLKGLEKALAVLDKDAECHPFTRIEYGQSWADSTKIALFVNFYEPSFDKDFSLGNATRLFELAGVKNPSDHAAAAVKIEEALANAYAGKPNDPARKVDTLYDVLTTAEIQSWVPNADIKTFLAFNLAKEESTYYLHYAGAAHMLKEFGKLYTEENAAALADFARYVLLNDYRNYMGDDFMNAGYKDDEEKPDPVAIAREYVKDSFNFYFGDQYAKRHFSPEAKADVTNMINMFISNYKVRIADNTWLSDATKAMALKKLNSLKVKIGYSEKLDDFLNELNIAALSDGGSALENAIAVNRHNTMRVAAAQGKPADKDKFPWPANTINAAYSPQDSSFVFPAGILQAPFYDVNAKPEENYAAIGWVIAHEITHAFDANGSRFDDTGNVSNWWTDEDKAAFDKLNAAVVAHYDGAELAPGIAESGLRTLGENTADLGGIACALEAMKQTVPNPDYKLFFKKAASIYVVSTDRDDFEYDALTDPHSNATVRVNQCIQNVQEFYDAFGIKPGDGMYIAPENRVKVW